MDSFSRQGISPHALGPSREATGGLAFECHGCRFGITYVNAGTIGAEVHLPFGGTKDTGNGHREAGQAALDVFTEWKSVYVDYSGRLQRAQIDTEGVAEP
jgi:hypothetical protein